jgi:VWFA-related protein
MSRPRGVWLCLVSAAALWPQAASPQNQSPNQPPALIKSETRLVLVDAVVTGKKGEYIRDLTAKDFRVWEDNKEQTIQSFSLESAVGDPAASAAPRTGYLVLVLDYAGMDAGDQIRARQAAAGFIDANTGPDRQMALAVFNGGFHIVQGFTGNAGRLKDVLTGGNSSAASINNAAAGTSASTELSGREKFRSLERLAIDLGAAPGRKTIVLLTGNLTVSNDQKTALTAAIEACNKSNVAVYPIDVRDVSLAARFSAENGSGGRGRGIGAMVGDESDGLRTGRGGGRGGGNADPGAALDPGGASQQVLFALASGTGGFVIRNAGELPDGLQKIGQEQKEYYILGYTPPESKGGSCHTLRVKVDRAGTTVRARSGYCTGKAQELLTETPAEKNLENRAAAAQTGNMAGSMQLPFFYVGPNTARVNIAMDIAPDAVKFDHKKDTFHAEVNVLGIASAPQGDGATGARFSDTVTLDFDDAEMQKWKQKPLHYEKEFKIASGQYKFTVVFSSGGESFGKLEQPLVVEPYQPGQLALSAVAFGKEVRKAADAGAALFGDQTQLIIGGMQLTPAGSNVFTKPEQAFCYFEVYTPDSANVSAAGDAAAGDTIEARILDGKTGEPKWDGGSMKLDRLAAGKSTIPVGMNVPIASLAPGAYRLEVTATDGAEKSVRRTADFEIK